MTFSMVFYKDLNHALSLNVPLCNECNAYDDDNSCLEIEQWSVKQQRPPHWSGDATVGK